MKAPNLFGVVLPILLLLPISFSAKDPIQRDFNDYVIELKKNIDPKQQKGSWWKKRGLSFDADCKKANDVTAIAGLLTEFETNLSAKAFNGEWEGRREEWRKETNAVESFDVFGDYLVEMINAMNEETFAEPWRSKRAAFVETIEKQSKDILMAALKKKEAITLNQEAFAAEFKKLYDAAAKKTFPGVKSDKPLEPKGNKMYYNVSLVLPDADGASVSVDNENSHQYHTVFRAGQFLDNAQSLVKQLQEAAMTQVPEGFGVTNSSDPGYVGYKKVVIEFQSDNISQSGKYPSVAIGIRKNGRKHDVELTVLTPFF